MVRAEKETDTDGSGDPGGRREAGGGQGGKGNAKA